MAKKSAGSPTAKRNGKGNECKYRERAGGEPSRTAKRTKTKIEINSYRLMASLSRPAVRAAFVMREQCESGQMGEEIDNGGRVAHGYTLGTRPTAKPSPGKVPNVCKCINVQVWDLSNSVSSRRRVVARRAAPKLSRQFQAYRATAQLPMTSADRAPWCPVKLSCFDVVKRSGYDLSNANFALRDASRPLQVMAAGMNELSIVSAESCVLSTSERRE